MKVDTDLVDFQQHKLVNIEALTAAKYKIKIDRAKPSINHGVGIKMYTDCIRHIAVTASCQERFTLLNLCAFIRIGEIYARWLCGGVDGDLTDLTATLL